MPSLPISRSPFDESTQVAPPADPSQPRYAVATRTPSEHTQPMDVPPPPHDVIVRPTPGAAIARQTKPMPVPTPMQSPRTPTPMPGSLAASSPTPMPPYVPPYAQTPQPIAAYVPTPTTLSGAAREAQTMAPPAPRGLRPARIAVALLVAGVAVGAAVFFATSHGGASEPSASDVRPAASPASPGMATAPPTPAPTPTPPPAPVIAVDAAVVVAPDDAAATPAITLPEPPPPPQVLQPPLPPAPGHKPPQQPTHKPSSTPAKPADNALLEAYTLIPNCMRRFVVAAALCGVGAPAALAQPAPPAPDKSDAQALVASGIKLFNAKDFVGALAVFRDAYGRFPSTKILLNIATTLARLDRDADAANTYQRYLDAPDADPAKRAKASTRRSAISIKKLAVVAITVTPPDARVQVGDGDWLAATALAHYRLAQGDVTITARRDGFVSASKSIHADAGGELSVSMVLAAKPPDVVVAPPPPHGPPPQTSLPAPQRSRLGVIALAHVAVEHPGVAGLVGVTFDARRWLALEAAALIGETSGGYAAIAVAPWRGPYRPFALVGAPVFVASGPRVSLRGALGFELDDCRAGCRCSSRPVSSVH